MPISRKLRMLMTERTISDLHTKMSYIRKLPQETQTQLFFDMCNFGINLYVRTEQTRYPDKTRKDIMREHFVSLKTKRG
jgi:tryptophanase